MKDTNPNPKKPHRGYAFIVYEREKDMKGTDSPRQSFHTENARILPYCYVSIARYSLYNGNEG